MVFAADHGSMARATCGRLIGAATAPAIAATTLDCGLRGRLRGRGTGKSSTDRHAAACPCTSARRSILIRTLIPLSGAAAPAEPLRPGAGEPDPRRAVGVLARADLVQRAMERAQRRQHRRLRGLGRGGDVHLHLGVQQHPRQRADGILLHGSRDVFPDAFLLAHLPGTAAITPDGVLSMYWGLVLGFGLFALLLVIVTRGRLGLPPS